MNERIRVLIADDHHVVRGGIRALLETEDDIDVIDEAGWYNEFCVKKGAPVS